MKSQHIVTLQQCKGLPRGTVACLQMPATSGLLQPPPVLTLRYPETFIEMTTQC